MNAAVLSALAIVLAAVITSRVGSKRQLVEIHELTNSNLTKVKNDLAKAVSKIEHLEAKIESLSVNGSSKGKGK